MVSSRTVAGCLGIATAVCSVLLATETPVVSAAPASDDQGYVDSTARCAAPDTAMFFGSTEASRIAICKTSSGQYQYRGVRVRDGARLIVAATKSGDDGFAADNDGVTYTVTSKSLVITQGDRVIRDEAFVDWHRPSSTASPATSTTATPQTTSATPLPPPLPAEVGGSRG